MLQFIRDTAKGWVAWIIVAVLIVPFALWGINEYFQGGDARSVAVINGKDISLNDYQRARQQQENRIRQMLGKNANPEILESMLQPQDVLDSVIERELLEQAADDIGFRMSDQQLASAIRAIEAFQQEGAFSKPTYERVLRNQGYSTAYFENIMRYDSAIQQINLGFRATGTVTKTDVENYIKLKNQEREIQHLIIPAGRFEKQDSVSDEEVEKYYNENKQRFVNPETVSVDYVELKIDELKKDITYTEEDLLNTYKDQKSNFGVGEERSARHILVQMENASDEKQAATALEKANKILSRIRGGEAFEELAKTSSDDPGSAASGGDLGFFGKGLMDPAFEDTAFAMKEGEVSEPVKTSFGYHIIKLDKIRPGSIKPFEKVRDEIISIYQQQKAEQQFYDQTETMTTVAYEQPDSLDAVAESLNLKIKTTEEFSSRGGKGIAANRKVVQAAFSNDVLEQGYNSEPIEAGVNHLVVIHKKNHKPESQKELAEVKNDIIAILGKQNATGKAEASGKELVASLESGTDPVAAAAKVASTWRETQFIARDEKKTDRAIVDAVFKMKKPADGKAVIKGVKLRNGDFAVIRLLSARSPDMTKIAEPDKLRMTNELSSLYTANEFNNFLSSLKAQADIQYLLDNIE